MQPFGIDSLKEEHEIIEIVVDDAMVCCITADCYIGDRPLTAERAIEAVKPQRFPGSEIEAVPGLNFRPLRPLRDIDIGRLVWIFIRETLQPIGLAFLGKAPPEGRP
ncbi:hypothetical protein JVX98_28340 [Ensifer sp. PDNC004]|uniref:hypothetical protein n=1 Tax=Ensifer sp. PDNC004 TaxID=2811423 RepID=UPI001964344F|nr:hypothetical protein [Ensifer sp. PDNC004]QRY68199.1 hypothetical protein JVX98_28340 [Ensifer sp. PDNC004]